MYVCTSATLHVVSHPWLERVTDLRPWSRQAYEMYVVPTLPNSKLGHTRVRGVLLVAAFREKLMEAKLVPQSTVHPMPYHHTHR